jgi:simple sugar transport system ATP-binding protein
MLQRWFLKPEFGPLVLLVAELVIFTAINPSFLSPLNISNTLAFSVELGLVALAMTLLMTSGEFDLSVGSLFGLTPVIMWTLANAGQMPLEVGFIVALLVAAFIGWVNGWFVTRLKIPSFLVTLGMLLVARGTALFITDGFPQRTWNAGGHWLSQVLVGDFYVGPVPHLHVAVLVHPGRDRPRLHADPDEVRQLDPGVRRQPQRGAGARRQRGPHQGDAVHPVVRAWQPLPASSAPSALGGQSQQRHRLRAGGDRHGGDRRHRAHGGRGTIIGTVMGIFILRIMRNGIVMIGVPGLAYNIFIGAIILGMMALIPRSSAGTNRGRAMAEELVRMENISKYYGSIRALDGVTFKVFRDEIVGLLGDNGAGKSTLIKVLSGAVRPTSGNIFIKGKKVEIRSTTDAISNGIETIYQDSALVTQLSISRNLFLGREPIRGPGFFNRMDHGAMEQVARDLLKRVGITKNIPPTTPIGSLSGGERQAVAIARAMHFHSDLIILDEPTNNLGVAETQGVLRFVRNARDTGHSCIFIAHNIHHVFQVVDRIVVMRQGKVVADDIDPKRTSVEEVEMVITGMSDDELAAAVHAPH